MVCDCRLLWLKNVKNNTFGRLFRRSFKQLKCIFQKEFAQYKPEEETKISDLVKETKFLQFCEPKEIIEEVEDVLEMYTEKKEEDKFEESVSPVVKGVVSLETNSKQTVAPEEKTQSKEPLVETSSKEYETTVRAVTQSKNDIKPEHGTDAVKASQERTGAKTSGAKITQNNAILMSLAAIVCIAIKNNLANE